MPIVRAWLPEGSDRGARVDRIRLGRGQDQAVELTEEQVARLRASGVDVQTEAGTPQSGDSDQETHEPDGGM